jgi:sugar O-acyltransferase (sialic acid O-acetyltransferase NeuD family)
MGMKRYDLILFGGGGHARVLLDALSATGQSIEVVVLDPALPVGPFPGYGGVAVLGGDGMAEKIAVANPEVMFAVACGAVRADRRRKRLFDLGSNLGLSPMTIIHPRAIVSRRAEFGPGAQVLAGAVVNPGARAGANAVLNTRAVIEHDCILGDHSNVSPAACLCGGAQLGEGAFAGAGSMILQGVRIGSWVTIGAGAVVLHDLPPEVTAVGNPARILRQAGGPS